MKKIGGCIALVLSVLTIGSCGEFLKLIGYPGERVEVIFQVDYAGSWQGTTAGVEYYTDEDVARTEPADGTTTNPISGTGQKDYTCRSAANWYYVSATKQEAGDAALAVRILRHVIETGERSVIVEAVTNEPYGTASVHLYAGDYDFVTGEFLKLVGAEP